MRRAFWLCFVCLMVCAAVPSRGQVLRFPSVSSAVIWKATADLQRALALAVIYRRAKDRIGQMVATGEVATLVDAGKYLAELRTAVGDARVNDAARIVRSYTTVGRALEGPLTRMPVAYLDHVTGRRRRGLTETTPLAARLQGVDDQLFPLRARLFGLDEEAAFDRIHPVRQTDFQEFGFMPGLKVKKVVIRWTVVTK